MGKNVTHDGPVLQTTKDKHRLTAQGEIQSERETGRWSR